MSDQAARKLSLREIELEVEAEGREWMRRRLEERLQREADRGNAVFPPEPKEGTASAQKGAAAAQRGGRG
jgi:predicted metal-dependent phosphoesterase TrpH